MPLDPIRLADTRAWIRKAQLDLRGARVDRDADPPLLEDIVFHSQQAAEKVMKAFLTWHDQPFRKTHNLVEIGEECVAIEPTLAPILRQAATLTEYASKFRYPGDPEEPTPQEAAAALELAERVFEAILLRLPKEVHPERANGG